MSRKGKVRLTVDYMNSKYECRGTKRSGKPMVVCSKVQPPKPKKAPAAPKLMSVDAAEKAVEKAAAAVTRAQDSLAKARMVAAERAREKARREAELEAKMDLARRLQSMARMPGREDIEPEEYGIVNPDFGPQVINGPTLLGPSFRRRRTRKPCGACRKR